MKLTKEFSGNQSKAEERAISVSAQAHEHYSGQAICVSFLSKEPRKRGARIKQTIAIMNTEEAAKLCEQLQGLL